MKKLFHSLVAGLLAFTLTACSSNTATGGTFKGTGQGNNGDIVVEVTYNDGKIEKVDVLEHKETAGISDEAIAKIPEAIVESQSLAVDTCSGATNSSKGILAAVEDALTQAGADVEAFKNKKVESEAAAVELKDATYDVVVLGAGGAGLAAAIEAKNAGANVAVVEKMPYAGGNTILSYAELACPNNWIQKEKGIEDSPELMAKEMWEGGGKVADKKMVDIVANNALAAAEWLKDEIGVEYQDYLVWEGGHSVARAVEPIKKGPGMINPMLDYAKEHGVEIFLNTKADELVVDKDGRVTGVEVSSEDKKATFTATNGVVLATGGFGANVEMREKYNTRWETLDESVATTNSPAIVGEGQVMAEKIGANLINMEHIQLYPFNNPMTGVFYGIEAPSWSGEGLIYVNKDGNRFVNEVAMRDVRAEGILAQGGEAYAIYNQAVADRLNLEEEFADEYARCLEGGVFYKADTLEEVADYFGINAKNLVKTMDKYNEGIKNNNDEFGRTTSMVTMEEGPWFILKGVVSVHHTMGGVEINENAEVLNTKGKVIEGLFAAGEVTGSVHGNNRVGTCAISDITVFGRIAGKNAAANK